MVNTSKQLIILVSLAILLVPSFLSLAQTGSFGLSPAKRELSLAPGATAYIPLTIVNNLGRSAIFKITVEDIEAAPDPKEAVTVLDGQTGPYSLKNFVFFEEDNLTIQNGEETTISLTVSLPNNLPPGSLHGVVFASVADGGEKEVGTVSRVGSLIFVKVTGGLDQAGRLKNFKLIAPSSLANRPIQFQILFANTGNSYLNPYGLIEITNIFGRAIKQIPIDPWFVLPTSQRLREVEAAISGFGPYTATLFLNRGYNDVIDSAVIKFWLLPWPTLTLTVLMVVIILWFSLKLKSRKK